MLEENKRALKGVNTLLYFIMIALAFVPGYAKLIVWDMASKSGEDPIAYRDVVGMFGSPYGWLLPLIVIIGIVLAAICLWANAKKWLKVVSCVYLIATFINLVSLAISPNGMGLLFKYAPGIVAWVHLILAIISFVFTFLMFKKPKEEAQNA